MREHVSHYKDVHVHVCKHRVSQTNVPASSIQSPRQQLGTSDLEPTRITVSIPTQRVYIQNTLRTEVGERNSPYSGHMVLLNDICHVILNPNAGSLRGRFRRGIPQHRVRLICFLSQQHLTGVYIAAVAAVQNSTHSNCTHCCFITQNLDSHL